MERSIIGFTALLLAGSSATSGFAQAPQNMGADRLGMPVGRAGRGAQSGYPIM